MNPASKKDKTAALAGRHIHIIGSGNLQNELLAGFLARETGACCTYGETPAPASRNGAENRQPDLFLVDCLGQDLTGCIECLRQEEDLPGPSRLVTFFNVKPGLGIEEQALREGVRGFFYEKDPPERMIKGLAAIFAGELWVSREIMTRCLLEEGRGGTTRTKELRILTSREIEILSLIAAGVTNEEIGQKLCISTNTVKTHVYNIFHKIKVPNRLQAALWAAKNL
ncbi:MAG: response regulator transcription factor [Thermodesulfobacteriota bacterium]